ncbi:hypothetical protein Ssi03_25510 [Sphaerisporangium siamense]|nr:hypothetical protein Ssi03_25510 [Sphaerisporangium siamense]
MFTDVHTSYLRIMARTSETASTGWAELVDHAVSRHPESVVDELRAQHEASVLETEGWRDLLAHAEAHLSLPAQLADSMDRYATGARLDVPPRQESPVGGGAVSLLPPAPQQPCACGLPGVPGVVHDLKGCEPPQVPSPAGQLPPIPPAATQVLPPGWTPGQEGAFQAFEAAHREHAAEQGVTPGRADGEPVGRDPYARDGGS